MACIEQVKQRSPLTTIELLIPDFCGDWKALATVMAAAPHVLNHNIETVPRMYRLARPQGIYERSLELLQRVRDDWPRAYSKSGLMVGLGETDEEVIATLRDLRQHRVDIVTIGQYLSPGPKHLAVDRFVTPEQFETYRRIGEQELGFLQVVSTPSPAAATTLARCSASWPAIPADRDPFLQLPFHQAGTDHRIVLNPEKSLGIGLRFEHQQTTTPRSAVCIHQKATAQWTTGTCFCAHPVAMGLQGRPPLLNG